MSADVATLRSLAVQVQQLADDVRVGAAQLRQAQGVQFQSRAADRYRNDLNHQAQRADGGVRALMDASRALNEHARLVEERLRQLAAFERWFHQRVREANGILSRARTAGDQALDAARRDAARVVSAARNAPAPGSPEWERFTARYR